MKLYNTLVLKDEYETKDEITVNLSHISLDMNISVKMMGIETSVNLRREDFYKLLLFMTEELKKHKIYIDGKV